MKTIISRIRSMRSILGIVVFSVFLMMTAFDVRAEVLDKANLFSQEELTRINDLAEDVKEHTHMDMVVFTTDDARGYSATTFADEVYNGAFGVEYGMGEDHSGFIYAIDMDNREVNILAYGKGILYLTDDETENILDQVYTDVSAGNYAASAETALSEVRNLYDRGIRNDQYTYDEKTGKIVKHTTVNPFEGIISALIGFFPALGFFTGVRSSYKNNAKQARNAGLNAGFVMGAMNNLHAGQDVLINERRYTRTIQNDSTRGGGGGRSTIHTGSSGRSYSGGGRKF